MKNQTKNKNKGKKKITALLLLLLLTVIMLSASTYAWFTANKTVTVSSLDVHVETKEGLQISADGFQWKTVLSNADIAAAATSYPTKIINQLPTDMEPVSSAGNVNPTNGHLRMFNGSIGEDTDGDFTVTATEATDATGAVGNYIAFDLYLKAEAGGQIYLTNDSKVVPKQGFTSKGLENAARVGFVVQGNTASDSSLTTIQELKTTTDSVYIWEPNSDVHTTYGVTSALEYGITTTVGPDAARLNYDGIKAANPTAIKLLQATSALNGTYFAPVTPSMVTKAAETTYKTAFVLQPGITKLRVYMWIEGQDVDCENNASGTDISYLLQFSTNAS